MACPPHNDVDVFANDVGFIAIADKDDRHLLGFNVTAGGGMGVTHSNKKTYPRLGDVLGFVTVEQAYIIAESILTTQRDNGNRQEYVTFFLLPDSLALTLLLVERYAMIY